MTVKESVVQHYLKLSSIKELVVDCGALQAVRMFMQSSFKS